MVSKEDNEMIANELEEKIIQQIEYYFGDINLNRDRFLKDLLTKDNGWVPLETLLTFKRLNSLSDDKNAIISALKKSKANLIEINESEDKIRRRVERPVPEFTEEYKSSLNERTVHVKGFPTDTKLDEIMKFCQQFGVIENIEMRRTFKTKDFKGCIFVLFSTKEEAQKLIDLEECKYLDNSLLRENKVSYFLRKKEYSDSRKSKKPFKKNNNSVEKTESVVKDETQEDEEKAENGSVAVKTHNPIRCEGAVLKLKGINKNTTFTAIKKVFAQHGKVAYVENVNDSLESFVRFSEKDGAKSALEKAKIVNDEESTLTKVEIDGKDVVAEVLTGDEEKDYWNSYEQNRSLNIDKKNQKKGRGFQGKGKKGNMWQRGKKRPFKGSDKSGPNRSKQIKTESD